MTPSSCKNTEKLHFPEQISNFEKISNKQSTEWARRFANELLINAS